MNYIKTLGDLRQLTKDLPDNTEINGVWGAYLFIEKDSSTITIDTEEMPEEYNT